MKLIDPLTQFWCYDPLLITSQEVKLVSPGVWKQSIELQQDQDSWSFSLDDLFDTSDEFSDLEIIQSGKLPSWLQFSPEADSSLSKILATPGNNDVGISSTQFSFIDAQGQTATLLLDFSVENINDAPFLVRETIHLHWLSIPQI